MPKARTKTSRGAQPNDNSGHPQEFQKPRIRGFAIDQVTQRPAANVPVTVWAEEEGGRVPLVRLVTDSAGYVSAPLPVTPAQVVVEVGGGDEITVAGDALRLPSPAFVAEIRPEQLSARTVPLPSVVEPDSVDMELSRHSLVVNKPISLGEDGCGAIQTVFAPARDVRLSRVVAIAPTEEDIEGGGAPAGETAVDVTVTDHQALSPSVLKRARALLYRQRWWPCGHSLGDIVYSLPLAPGESIDLATVEWSRLDEVLRSDTVALRERLRHDQRRDRAIDESIIAGLSESQWGFSLLGGVAQTHGGSASATIPVSGVPIDAGAASGGAGSLGGGIAFTSGNRDVEAFSQQDVHDRIRQGTSVVRTLASTVIMQATQSEVSRAETRTVTNYNRCHTLTVQYYEVLRNFRLETTFTGSTPIVLVPFASFEFNRARALRWRTALEPVLLEPGLARGFDVLAHEAYAGSSSPGGEPGGGQPEPATVQLSSITVRLRSGAQGNAADESHTDQNATWGKVWINLVLESGHEPLVWFKQAVGEAGSGSDGSAGHPLKVGTRDLTVAVTPASPLAGIDPALIRFVKVAWIEANDNDMWNYNGIRLSFTATGGEAPSGRLLVHGEEEYTGTPIQRFDDSFGRTQHWTGPVTIEWDSVEEDDSEPAPSPQPPADETESESHSALGALLVGHLNDNRDYYNRAVWLGQDQGTIRDLLEHVLANEPQLVHTIHERPVAAAGRWVAFAIDAVPEAPETPRTPLVDLVSLPTRGLFAEGLLGGCSTCEPRDVTRMVDWAPRQPPRIGDVDLGPQGETPAIAPTSLPSPVVAISQAPSIPDPAGLAAALQLLGTPNVFRDMSGLTQVGELLDDLIAGSVSSEEIAGRAKSAKSVLEQANRAPGLPGGGGAPTSPSRTPPSESDAGRQLDRLQAIQAARSAGFLTDEDARNALLGVYGGEEISAVELARGDATAKALAWSDLINFSVPAEVRAAVEERGLTVVPASTGWGDLNLDYYSVRISKLPKIAGEQVDAAGLLKHIRTNLNEFVDTNNSEFVPLEAQDETKWLSTDPVKAVVNIKINVGSMANLPPIGMAIDQALVVCAQASPSHWILSTLRGGIAWGHPVSGNRRWGIEADGNGWVLYTKGADRATSWYDWIPNAANVIWRGADNLWQGFQAKVAAFVNTMGGKATIEWTISDRYDWDSVRERVTPASTEV